MKKREPNSENLKKVLARQVPDRPVLFEFTLNMPLYERLSGSPLQAGADALARQIKVIEGMSAAGYDYDC